MPRRLTWLGVVTTLALVAGVVFIDPWRADAAGSVFEPLPTGSILNRLEPSMLDTPRPSARHILLITLDTLRADHLSCYGYPRKTSPFLDTVARDGVRFTRAFAPMATTAPSHASLLTGLYPIQHGVRKNGHRLNDGVATLPELLSAAGFTTAGVVSTNRHFAAGNIHQGFDFFDEPVRDDAPVQYRTAERTLSRALDWLGRTPRSQKIFLWIHLFDAHQPYIARPAYLDATRLADPSDELARVELYDSEIRYLDSSVQSFFNGAGDLGFDDFLTVIVADHGEGLGNHGWWGHGKHIYNEQVRVPLILQWPDGRFAGTTVDDVVEINDIMPSILVAAGVDADTIARDRRLPIEGTPLQRLLDRRAGAAGEFGYAFIERRSFDGSSRRTENFAEGETLALLSSEWKYIYRSAQRDALYDMERDFYEQHDLIDSAALAAASLESALEEVIRALTATASFKEQMVPDETVRALRSLGYVP